MKENYNVMDLFAGIGGASYAGRLIGNWRTICYVEWDKYCQKVIQQRIKDGIFDDAPIWGDIQTFDGKPWAGSVDIVTAGFPCQPFSVGGKKRGEKDKRNMWFDTLRIIGEVRPQYTFLENVPGLITSGYFGRVLGDLTEIRYDCRWIIVSAADVGAPHLRKRLWILGFNTDSCNASRTGESYREDMVSAKWSTKKVQQNGIGWKCELGTVNVAERISSYSEALRILHGIPDRCNRLKGLGNAWVPAVAATAWNVLTEGLI